MTVRSFILLTEVIFCGGLTACDDGDIYPKEVTVDEETVAKIDVIFKDIETWPEEYNVALAAFSKDNSAYPLLSQNIAIPTEGEVQHLKLSNLPENCDYISIALLQKSRKSVYLFHTDTIQYKKDEPIELDKVQIDLADYGRLQNQLFNQCLTCHGASTQAAAGLNLIENKSYENMVNVLSTRSDKKRITPYVVGESFIVEVLENANAVSYNHTTLTTLKAEDIQLLKSWINKGAPK